MTGLILSKSVGTKKRCLPYLHIGASGHYFPDVLGNYTLQLCRKKHLILGHDFCGDVVNTFLWGCDFIKMEIKGQCPWA